MDDYKKIVEMIKAEFPEAAIGADVIVGYPGESDADFHETFTYLRESPITHFHVFPFSKRKGTTAAKLEEQVPHAVKKDRVKTLMMLGQVKLDDFAKTLLDREFDVLFENGEDGVFQGYLPQFIKVEVKSDKNLRNEIKKVKLTSYRSNLFKAQLI